MFSRHTGGFRTASLFAAVSFLGLFVVAAGCGKSVGPSGTVSGKVTCDGQAVTEGTVVFISAQGRGASGKLDSQGAYTLKTVESGEKVPVGEYQVAVQPPPPEQADLSKVSADDVKAAIAKGLPVPGDPVKKEYPNIPQKYRNQANSGWKLMVKEGANTFDLEMKK